MKSVRTAAAVAVAGGLLASGSLALAAGPRAHAATTHGGAIHVLLSQFSPTTAKITFTGAIGDYGTITTETKQGKPSSNGNYGAIKLKHGTMLIDAAAFNRKLNSARPQMNASNCSFYLSGSGGSTILSGTGAYAGAHGKVTLTATFAGVSPKKADGKCNDSNSAPTYGFFSTITGSGTVHFG